MRNAIPKKKSQDAAFAVCCKLKMNLWTWKRSDEGYRMMRTLKEMGKLKYKIKLILLWPSF
jgi:hypothetical protein